MARIRHGKTSRGFLALLGCVWFAGCLTPHPGPPEPHGKADALQEALRTAKVDKTEVGFWRRSPAAVLQEVPVGTPLAQAQAVMQRHGFSCRQEKMDPARVCLICKASQWAGLVGSDVLTVTFYCRWDKVTEVKVITYHN